MILRKSFILAVIATALVADTFAVPALSANTESNLPNETPGCGDLRDAILRAQTL